MTRAVLLALLCCVAIASGAGVGAANEPPIATAGLDQHVEQGNTVYLDASGSGDSDGDIVGYQWTITAPDGSTMSPACPTCMRTDFRADATGTYEVIAIVTDDDGSARSDTLYVEVTEAEPPSIELSGPDGVTTGETATYTATATAGDDDLATISWRRGGEVVATETVSGTDAERTRSRSFSETGEHEITAVAVDTSGRTGRVTHTVEATEPVRRSGGSGGPGTSPIRVKPDGSSATLHISNGEVWGTDGGERTPSTVLTEDEVDQMADMEGVHSQISPQGHEELEVTGEEKVDKIQSMTHGSGFSTDVSGDLAVTDDGLESNPFGEVNTRGSRTDDTGGGGTDGDGNTGGNDGGQSRTGSVPDSAWDKWL